MNSVFRILESHKKVSVHLPMAY